MTAQFSAALVGNFSPNQAMVPAFQCINSSTQIIEYGEALQAMCAAIARLSGDHVVSRLAVHGKDVADALIEAADVLRFEAEALRKGAV